MYAVNNLRLPDMRSVGMGECGITQSFLFNPALIGRESSKSLDINYFNRYGLKELGVMNLLFSYPATFLPIGVNISSFGYDRYRESMFRIFLGKSLNEKWNIGISIQYSIIQTELTEEHPQYLSTDIGIIYSLVEKLLIGMLIMDLPSVAIKKEDIEKFEKKLIDMTSSNIKIEKICDWAKLLDIKIKEEWKLDKNLQGIFQWKVLLFLTA